MLQLDIETAQTKENKMFEITIKGETEDELFSNLADLAARLAGPHQPLRSRKAPAKAEAPAEKEYTAADEEDSPPQPMPAGANAVVDAGTGQPVAEIITAEFVEAEPVKQMTMTDVKVAAAKLAATDTPKLASILKKYNAAKLSEVAPDALGDFAGEVMDALG